MRQTSASEFSTWKEYFRLKEERDLVEHNKWEFYAAMIAAEVRRSYVKNSSKVSIKDFLIDFKRALELSKKKVLDKPRTREDAAQRAKAAVRRWLRR
jgi:hypothetical protein